MKKISIMLIALIIVTAGAFLGMRLRDHSPMLTHPEPQAVLPQASDPIMMCFRYDHKLPSGFADRAFLTMRITGPGGTNVTGEYRNYPAESDSKTGTFAGTIGPMNPETSSRTAEVWWNSLAEGMRVTEQLRIAFGEGGAVAQFGEMVDRGDGVYVYKDPSNLTSGFQMEQVGCEE